MDFPIKQSDFSRVRYTSPYGRRVHPITGARGAFHRGIDISSMGRNGVIDLIAPADGTVVYNRVNSGGPSNGYGYYFCIRHANNVFTFYAHNYARSSFNEGQRIRKGQAFAKIGTTGASTGPHVHFEVHHGRHAFPSQTSVGSSSDPTVDPVKEYFPSLEGYFLKSSLRGFNPNSKEYTKALWVGKVVSDRLNVRKEPTTSGDRVQTLRKGDTVVIYSEIGDRATRWLDIGDGRFVSNARGDYVKPVTELLYEATTTANSLNVRELPSSDYDVVRTLPRGSTVKVYAEFNGWVYIGKGEFVSRQFIEEKSPVKEEEEEMLENAILIFSFADFPMAEGLAKRFNAPIFLRDAGEETINTKHLIIIGGGPSEKAKAEKTTDLSGGNRYETAVKVAQYINTL